MWKKIIQSQYVYSIISKFCIVILGVANSVLINRSLGPSMKGEYAYILNIASLVVLILNLGIYQSYPFYRRKKVPALREKYNSIVFLQFAAYMLLAIILLLFNRQQSWFFIFTLVPIMVLSRQLNFISLIENVKLRNTINMLDEFLYTAVTLVIFLVAPHNITILIAALYIKEIAAVVTIVVLYKLKFSISSFNMQFLSEILRFGFFPMLTMLLITMNYQVDVLILKWYVSFEQIGYYTIGVGLANQAWVIPDAFKDVLFAKTARDDALRDIKFSLIFNLLFSIGIFILFAFAGKYVIMILYGMEFIPAYQVTLIIFFGTISMVLFKLLMPLYNAKGKQKSSFVILFVSVLLNIVLNVILIPRYGINGAAFASVISYSVCGVTFWLGVKLWVNREEQS